MLECKVCRVHLHVDNCFVDYHDHLDINNRTDHLCHKLSKQTEQTTQHYSIQSLTDVLLQILANAEPHSTQAASAPSTLTISASLLALSATPVHFCTAIATLSSRWEPIASASLHV